jgi:hypothetical protein
MVVALKLEDLDVGIAVDMHFDNMVEAADNMEEVDSMEFAEEINFVKAVAVVVVVVVFVDNHYQCC